MMQFLFSAQQRFLTPLLLTGLVAALAMGSLVGCAHHDGADPLHGKTLEEHPDTLHSMHDLALLYQNQGRYDEAEPLYVKSLELRRRMLSEEHPDTLQSMHNLAMVYENQGHYDEAESLYVKTLELRRRALGEEHPDTLQSMNNLARVYENQSRYEEAEPLYVERLEVRRRVLGEEHPKTLYSMKRLAKFYESWHAAEPGRGYDAKAAEWRAKLPVDDEAVVATSRVWGLVAIVVVFVIMMS